MVFLVVVVDLVLLQEITVEVTEEGSVIVEAQVEAMGDMAYLEEIMEGVMVCLEEEGESFPGVVMEVEIVE